MKKIKTNVISQKKKKTDFNNILTRKLITDCKIKFFYLVLK